MPARDIYHDTVRKALVKDGWAITHDPLRLEWGGKDLFIDLGAQEIIAAQKAERKIAIEVKSFVGKSEVDDLEKALGQYVLYHDVLAEKEPDRTLYLAVHAVIYVDLFEGPIGSLLLKNSRVQLMVFDPNKDE
ncbi:MAG TPA: XisH family protein, partial [Blastocatellia bacterium]|nr:XisH family protein [Blastocatellia bacterium]